MCISCMWKIRPVSKCCHLRHFSFFTVIEEDTKIFSCELPHGKQIKRKTKHKIKEKNDKNTISFKESRINTLLWIMHGELFSGDCRFSN